MRALLLALLLLMAGITQSGGAAGTLFIEDNTNGDAGGDQVYSFAEISGKFPTHLVPNAGAAEAEYRATDTVQVGDGAGSAATTLKDTNVTVVFDATKTLTVAVNTGLSGRRVELGTKIGSGLAPGGRDGVKIRTAAALSLRGNIYLYGCQIRSALGLTMLPQLGTPPTPGVGELVNCLVEWGNAAGQIGNPSSGNFALIYNLDIMFSGGAATISTFGADYADRITIEGTGGFGRFINSAGSALEIARVTLIGTPGVCDVRQTSAGGTIWNFYEIEWSGAKPQFDTITAQIMEWRGFDPLFYDPRTNTPKSGIPVDLLNRFGVMVVDAITDSEGRISFNSGLASGRVKVRRHITGPTIEEQGPFTLRFNHKGAINYAFLPGQRTIVWPGRNYSTGVGTARQLANCAPNIALIPTDPTGFAGNEEWRASLG